MTRIPAIEIEEAKGRAAELLGMLRKKLGRVPNIFKVLSQSPAVLEGQIAFGGALAKGSLSLLFREKIALFIAELNNCEYCVAAHRVFSRNAGLSEEDITQALLGKSSDAREEAGLSFVRLLHEQRGVVQDAAVTALKEAGFTDGEIVEIIANACMTIFTSYVNHVAGTEIDFPSSERPAKR